MPTVQISAVVVSSAALARLCRKGIFVVRTIWFPRRPVTAGMNDRVRLHTRHVLIVLLLAVILLVIGRVSAGWF